MQKSFAFSGSRAVSKSHTSMYAVECSAIKAVPTGARLALHVKPKARQASLAPTPAACYAALMPASLSSTWSYDFADTPALDSFNICGCVTGNSNNGGGLGGSSSLYPAGDDGWCGRSICGSDDCESFGSSDNSSIAGSESTASISPSACAEHSISSPAGSSNSMTVLLSAEVVEQFSRWSSSDHSNSCSMEVQECR